MPYEAEISRTNPSCFLFLLDQSGSMQDPFGSGESQRKKADAVADAINRLLQNITLKCTKEEGIRSYYYVSVIGYGAKVGPALGGVLAERELVDISDIGAYPVRIEERAKKVEDGAGGLVEQKVRMPIWFEPVADGGTPMCQALGLAEKILTSWLIEHPSCFPPIVINITDGEATDGDPAPAIRRVIDLESTDGSVLVFNAHCSSSRSTPVVFPDSDASLPDEFSKKMYQLSSMLPPHLKDAARQEGYATSESTRGFAFNAGIEDIITFLDIGTRPGNLR